jgi:hypothetical protein
MSVFRAQPAVSCVLAVGLVVRLVRIVAALRKVRAVVMAVVMLARPVLMGSAGLLGEQPQPLTLDFERLLKVLHMAESP